MRVKRDLFYVGGRINKKKRKREYVEAQRKMYREKP